MKSVMQHQFSNIPRANIQRSVFDRTHGYKTSFDAGYLIPFLVDMVMPGDTFNVDATMFARLATPIYPLMDNLYLDVHYFFVPYRLVWDNFKAFMGERDDADVMPSHTIPQMAYGAGGCTIGTLGDYFGLPIAIANMKCNTLPFRAYNLIWNEWYKAEFIQDSVTVDVDNGDDDIADYVLLRRNKRHDYFTSCIPWPQAGTASELPSFNVLGIGIGDSTAAVENAGDYTAANFRWRETGATAEADFHGWEILAAGAATGAGDAHLAVEEDGTTGYPHIRAEGATVNELREAFQIQKLLERDARGGVRYAEIIMAHFNVSDPMHAVLQRPEYLGGSSAPVVITPVANTSSTGATVTGVQGYTAGVGTITCRAGFTKSFTEHGLVMGLLSVRADLTYQQGKQRMWDISTKYDLYWPALCNIGEQAVLTSEIFADGTAHDDIVFGYQEAWAEYRYKPSQITGKLRSVDAGSLDAWHLSQDLADHPTLSDTFIVENPPMSRVIAVNTEPHFILDSYIKMRCARPMPVYSVPGDIDRF